MSDYPKLKNAPITEALIDIQFEVPPDTTLDTLAQFQSRISDILPLREVSQIAGVEFRHNQEGPPEVVALTFGINGYVYQSADRKTIFQVKLGGFTLSKLEPYDGWEALKDEAVKLWALYSEFVKPVKVNRLAVKYTNKIRLPLGADYKTYFKTTPEICLLYPYPLPRDLTRFRMPFTDSE